MSVIESIMMFVVDANDYTRMQLCNEIDDSVTYSRFLDWNRRCLENQGYVELNWLLELCDRIKKNRIQLMDLESCAAFSASGIYYNDDGQLCIVNPR